MHQNCITAAVAAAASFPLRTGWLLKVIELDEVADEIGLATPGSAESTRSLCTAGKPEAREIRRTVPTMIRYLLRLKGRWLHALRASRQLLTVPARPCRPARVHGGYIKGQSKVHDPGRPGGIAR